MSIELIAIDLDGTLLRDDKSISSEDIEIIQEAKQAGKEVVICSGRPTAAVQTFTQELGLSGQDHYVILYNGGLVINNHTKEKIWSHLFPTPRIIEVAQELERLGLPVSLVSETYVDYLTDFSYDLSVYPINQFLLEHHVHPAHQIKATDEFYKIVCACPSASYLEVRLKHIRPEIWEEFSVMRSHPFQIDIMPKGINKGMGIRKLVDYLGLSMENTLGIGDEKNDIEMLEAVKISVAMENAAADIKRLADYITKSNEASGVAYAIEKLVLHK